MSTNNGSTVYRYFYKRTLGPEPNRSEQIRTDSSSCSFTVRNTLFLNCVKKKKKKIYIYVYVYVYVYLMLPSFRHQSTQPRSVLDRMVSLLRRWTGTTDRAPGGRTGLIWSCSSAPLLLCQCEPQLQSTDTSSLDRAEGLTRGEGNHI